MEGDAHLGKKVQYVAIANYGPEQPNKRQVHLIHSELFPQLWKKGHHALPGEMGEDITTSGLDLLGLQQAKLNIGAEAVVGITVLREPWPCYLLDKFQGGLINAVLDRERCQWGSCKKVRRNGHRCNRWRSKERGWNRSLTSRGRAKAAGSGLKKTGIL